MELGLDLIEVSWINNLSIYVIKFYSIRAYTINLIMKLTGIS